MERLRIYTNILYNLVVQKNENGNIKLHMRNVREISEKISIIDERKGLKYTENLFTFKLKLSDEEEENFNINEKVFFDQLHDITKTIVGNSKKLFSLLWDFASCFCDVITSKSEGFLEKKD